MSSEESNSNNPQPPAAPAGKPQSSVGLVVLCLVAMAVLVWALAPGRGRFQPAPLRQVPTDCPRTVADFVPSDVTDFPFVDLHALPPAQRNHVLFRLNMEPCPCGCNTSIAICRGAHANCPVCRGLADKIVADEQGAASRTPASDNQK